jgi:hypothetical protein
MRSMRKGLPGSCNRAARMSSGIGLSPYLGGYRAFFRGLRQRLDYNVRCARYAA